MTAANLAAMQKTQMKAMQSTLRRDGQHRNDVKLTLDSTTTLDVSGPGRIDAAENIHDLTQQLDALSIASSTHFTMINGFGRTASKTSGRGCCCCKPIAAVIITMTGLFLLIIGGVVLMAECKCEFFFNFE